MEIFNLALSGAKCIKPKTFVDERGFFYEFYRKSAYTMHGMDCEFVQDNHSFSVKGTIRGMHFQSQPGQAKLISVIEGKIFDVIVDIRTDSPTFGKWEGVVLDAKEGGQLFIPIGFAHGFAVLSEKAHVFYKLSNAFDPQSEKTFRFDDPQVDIEWPFEHPILSERDRTAPFFHEVIQC